MVTDKIKFSIFCLVVFCLVSLPVSQVVLLGYVPKTSSVYSFYTTDVALKLSGASVVKNGNASIVSCSAQNAKQVRKNLTNVLGESVQVNSPSQDFLNEVTMFLSNKVLYSENLNGTEILYCYEGSITNFVMIDGQKVNLQVAKTPNYIVIGTPLILGSF